MDKTILITGASSGIGKACAEKFAAAGARLILVARRQEMLEAVAEELSVKHNVDVFSIALDVRKRKDVLESLGNLPEEWSKVDVLVNNAGLARGLEKIHEGNLDDWEEMIDANVKGLLYVSRTIIPKMVAQGDGFVINIGSIAGRQVYPNGGVYCGTKHAVRALSEGMTQDLNGQGVRVCNIEPGLVETEFSLVRFHGEEDKAKGVYVGYTPLRGEDIADIAFFVASRPKHVMIQNVLVTPTDQASATIVHKKV